jgi:hypothetical protein
METDVLEPPHTVKFIDLTTPKPRKRSPRMAKLLNLEPGKSVIINHARFKTGFAAWIAQARARTGRDYGYQKIRGKRYKVFLPQAA